VEAAMSVIYALWMREVRKYFRSPAQMIGTLGSPVMYLGVLGFGLGPIFQRAGEGSYLQFMAPGIMCMTDPLHVDVLGDGAALGPAVRLPQGDARRARAAPHDHGGTNRRRRDRRAVSGLLVFVVSLLAGFRPAHVLVVPTAILVMALVALVFSAMGNDHRLEPEGDAGVPDHHELPRHADLLPLRARCIRFETFPAALTC
jgi:ABC-2 type transport system permease protein